MKRYLLFVASVIALLLAACESDSRTNSDASNAQTRETLAVTLAVGEHKDIELPISQNAVYAVTTAVNTAIGSELNSTSSNVRYSVSDAAPAVRPVLRLVGVKGGVETIITQSNNGGQTTTMNVIVTVMPRADGDVIGGNPIDPSNPGGGTGGGGGGSQPPTPPNPTDPGEKPSYDPNACVTTGFFYIDDDFNDVEGHFGPDGAAYMRSLIANPIYSSVIRFFYPAITRPATMSFVDFGQYLYTAKNGAVVNFDVQMAQHLFGITDSRYFYVQSNGLCMRGEIPSSFMTPPNKSLVWVSANYAETI